MIRRARKSDIKAINEILEIFKLQPIRKSLLRDYCLVSEREGQVTGFIWAAIPLSHTFAYVDYWTVHPAFKGDGIRLADALIAEMKRRKIEQIFSVVNGGSSFSKESARIQEKMGLKTMPAQYRILLAKTDQMELIGKEAR